MRRGPTILLPPTLGNISRGSQDSFTPENELLMDPNSLFKIKGTPFSPQTYVELPKIRFGEGMCSQWTKVPVHDCWASVAIFTSSRKHI
jgi:hypothetical protein